LLPVTRLLCLLSLLAFLGFYLGHSLWWLVVLTLAANFIYPTLMPMGEALATRMVVQTHLDYGKVRLCGSFAFIVASTLVGALVGNFGSDWVLHTMVAGLLIMLGLSLLPLRPAPGAARGAGQGLAARHAQVGPGAPLPAHHRPAAGEPCGLLRFQRHLLEERRLQRHPDRVSLGSGSGGGDRHVRRGQALPPALRRPDPVSGGGPWLRGALGAARQFYRLAVLVLGQLLHGVTFCVSHLGAIRFMTRQLPAEQQIPTQALYAALGLGMTVAALMAICGVLFEPLGGGIFFIMVLVVLPVFVLRLREESPEQGR
jgi:PPP family 3-phenylpropionic acid transporter